MEADYKVKLEVFEGPLDLLLYLIKKEEVDIYDIPIERITNQYMEYLTLMQMLNLEVPVRPRTGKEYTAAFQAAGIWGNVRYISPLVAYKRFIPMHYLLPSENGHNVLGMRAQLGYVQGFGGDVAPPNNRFYAGGENELRGFDVRGATPYGYVPSRVEFQLTNPDGSCVPRDPTRSEEQTSE